MEPCSSPDCMWMYSESGSLRKHSSSTSHSLSHPCCLWSLLRAQEHVPQVFQPDTDAILMKMAPCAMWQNPAHPYCLLLNERWEPGMPQSRLLHIQVHANTANSCQTRPTLTGLLLRQALAQVGSGLASWSALTDVMSVAIWGEREYN